MFVRRHGHRVHKLHVVRHDDACDGAFGRRDADGAIDHVRRLSGCRNRLCIRRDILKQRVQIHFLQIIAADRRRRLLSDQRDDGNVIELRVVESCQQMNRTRTGCGNARTNLAGELRMRAGHERGHFFMPDADVIERFARAIDGAHESIDAVAGIPE